MKSIKFVEYINKIYKNNIVYDNDRNLIDYLFFIFPPRLREGMFYLKVFKNIPKNIMNYKKIKKLYMQFETNFGNYKEDKKNIYKSIKKLSIKKEDGFEFAKEFYKNNIKLTKKGKINKTKIILVCLVKDELRRMKEFYKHYKTLGVENFVFIDNDSTDGTYEYLETIKNVTIFKVYDKYSTIKRQAWVTKILSYFGYNNWYLIVDSDELLVYNDCENKNIDKLVSFASKKRLYRIKGLMLDMYSNDNFLEINEKDKKSIKEKYCYFDNDNYIKKDHKSFELIEGGMRKRVFGKYDNLSPFLSKYPIMYYQKGDLQYNSHYSYPFYKNFNIDLNVALLHYKFLGEDLEKIKNRAKEKNYALGSKEYKVYLKAYNQSKNLKLIYNKSKKYENSKSLETIEIINPIVWRE